LGRGRPRYEQRAGNRASGSGQSANAVSRCGRIKCPQDTGPQSPAGATRLAGLICAGPSLPSHGPHCEQRLEFLQSATICCDPRPPMRGLRHVDLKSERDHARLSDITRRRVRWDRALVGLRGTRNRRPARILMAHCQAEQPNARRPHCTPLRFRARTDARRQLG
jgi:hypothetical protein